MCNISIRAFESPCPCRGDTHTYTFLEITYIFLRSMSVLINGTTSSNFEMRKFLCQGDTLSPFQFLLVTSSWVQVHQLVDNMILICDGNLNNLWSVKALFLGFKLASGLCVNLNKSKVYEINLQKDLLIAASHFLACSIPFNFLGIQVGLDLKKKSAWNHIVDKVRKRLF